MRFGFSDAEIEEMPFARLAQRMLGEEARQKIEEREKRRELWIHLCALVYVGRVQSDPPTTREEYLRDKKNQERANQGKPPIGPTPKEWKRRAQARRFWEDLVNDINAAVWHPAHFERVFRYPDNLFGDPPPLPKESVKPASQADVRREIEEREQRLRASLQAAAKHDQEESS